MSPVDNIERRIEQLHRSTSAATDKRILDDAFMALRASLQGRQTSIWRAIMASRITRPLAAAAVILIAVSLILNGPVRNAETVEGFYKTLAGAKNICVSKFQAGQTAPEQQVWTSQSLQVRLFKTGTGDQAQFALWDIGNKVQMTMFLSSVQTEALTEQKLEDLEKSLTPSFALAPFFDAADVPENARWNRVSDPAVIALIPGCAVYDLTWQPQDAPAGGTIHRKWRVFVDSKTHLPGKTEFYSKSGSQAEYELESYVIVTYPTESEIRDLVANTFGRPGGRTGGPEYVPTPGIDR